MNQLFSLTGAAFLTFGMGINANAYAIPSTLDQSLQQVLLDTVAAPELRAGNPSIPEIESLLTNTTTDLSESATQKSPEVIKPQIKQSFGKSPIHFEPNLGQTDDAVKFTARGPGYILYLTETEAVFSLAAPHKPEDDRQAQDNNAIPDPLAGLEVEKEITPPEVLRMQLLGKTFNPKAKVSGLEKRKSYSNYYLGSDKTNWQSNVPHYNKVEYEDVYPGIDLVYYGNPQQLEYDFVVAPGADPDQIQLAFEGSDDITVADNGNLNLTVNDREVAFKAPVIYQMKDGKREAIAGHYSIEKNQLKLADKVTTETKVGFQLAAYDASLPLVIDPVLEYSSYLGGSDIDHSQDIAVDSNGDAVITGYTFSNNFPDAYALQGSLVSGHDAFVTRIDGNGQLVFSTYLGGSDRDYGYGVAVDNNGDTVTTGFTYSTNFPTANYLQGSNAGRNDAFVTRLNSSGQLVSSTYLGGSGTEQGRDVAIHNNGDLVITGTTSSTDFPTANALQGGHAGGGDDAFVTRVKSNGQLVFSTYLGGSATASEGGEGIAVDDNGDTVVTGMTYSTNFPILNALQENKAGDFDAFVTRLDSSGQLQFSTYLGGENRDISRDITVDSNGDAVITGNTVSTNFPTANAFQGSLAGSNDVFITRLDSSGQLQFSTYLGGNSSDAGQGIAVDSSGYTLIMGHTQSTNFPTANALQTSKSGSSDIFITRFDSSGQLHFGTYLGGDRSDYGDGIAVNSNGDALVTGYTDSSNFPTSTGAYQPNDPYTGNNIRDAFVTRISFDDNQVPTADELNLTTAEDTNLAIELTGTDPDANTLNFTVETQPAHGQLQGTEPFLTYVPDTDFNGIDSFTYTASDGSLDSNPATVTIQVNPVNNPPIADFNVDFVTGVPPFIINFDASSSSDDGEIVRYQWEAFRGGLRIGEQVSYSYDRIGNFLIKLTVTDDQGAVSTKESSVVIRGLGSYLRNLLPDQTAVMPAIINGFATSMVGIDRVQIEIQDNVTGLWWTGTEWGERVEHSATITETINEETDWEYIFNLGGNNGSGNYRLVTTAVDINGEQEPTPRETNFTTTDDPNYLLEVIVETPIYDQLLTLPVILSGSATSPMAVESVVIGIYDQRTGKWWNGESWGDWQLNPALSSAVNNNLHNWEYNFNPTGSGGSGVYRAYVRVNDITGAVSRSAQVPFKAFGDTIVAFESIINSPVADEAIMLPYSITGTASAPEGVRDLLIGIKDTASGLWWTGSGWGDWILHSATIDEVGTTSVNWQYGFDPSDTNGSGNYRIHTRAVDVSGLRESESTQLNFTGLDSGNLTLDTLIDIPFRNQLLPLPADLSGTAISPVGIDTVLVGIRDTVNDLWWNGSSWGGWQLNPTPVTPVNGTLVSWNYNFDPTASGGSGQYRAYVRARDIHGVLADSIQVQFQAYDASGVAFESIIHTPTSNQVTNQPLTIDGTATAPTGVSSVLLGIRDEVSKLWWNGSDWGEWILMTVNAVQVDSTSANWSYDFDPSGSSHSGRFRVYTRAVDMNNVRSGSAQLSFTVTP